MGITNWDKNLISALEPEGYRGKIISVDHLSDLNDDIDALHRQGLFDEVFFNEELSGFDYTIPDGISRAKSLIIAAAPQPQVRVTFMLEDEKLACIIPPTYSYATDRKIENLLRRQLEPAGWLDTAKTISPIFQDWEAFTAWRHLSRIYHALKTAGKSSVF